MQNSVTLNTRACQGSFAALPFCNTSLSLDERVDDLIERIWATNQSVIPALLTARNFGSSAMPLLGVPEYDWGLNSIHGVQSSCVSDASSGTVYCPTSFMNPVNFGQSFNKSAMRELGYTIAIESRALWLAGAVEEGPRNHIGLDHWSPNINVRGLFAGGVAAQLALPLDSRPPPSSPPPIPHRRSPRTPDGAVIAKCQARTRC